MSARLRLEQAAAWIPANRYAKQQNGDCQTGYKSTKSLLARLAHEFVPYWEVYRLRSCGFYLATQQLHVALVGYCELTRQVAFRTTTLYEMCKKCRILLPGGEVKYSCFRRRMEEEGLFRNVALGLVASTVC